MAVVRARKIGGASDEPIELGSKRVQHRSARLSGWDAFRVSGERRKVGIPTSRKPTRHGNLEVLGCFRERRAVARQTRLPFLKAFCTTPSNRFGRRGKLVGHEERVGRPFHELLGRDDLVRAEWRTVRSRRVALVGRRVANDGSYSNEARTFVGDRRSGRRENGGDVIAVVDAFGMPSVCSKSGEDVFTEAQVGPAVDGDSVVVPEHDELAELQVTSDRCSFGRHAFHDVAVRSDHPGTVIENRMPRLVETGREVPLRHRHPHAIADALPERAGRRLDAWRDVGLRMPGCEAPPLPKLADVVEGNLVATQVKQRVLQHRRMPAGQDEAVAVRPVRMGRVVPPQLGEKRPAKRRKCHRRAGVTRISRLHRIHAQASNRLDCELVELRGVSHAVVLLCGAPDLAGHTQTQKVRRRFFDGRWTSPQIATNNPERGRPVVDCFNRVCFITGSRAGGMHASDFRAQGNHRRRDSGRLHTGNDEALRQRRLRCHRGKRSGETRPLHRRALSRSRRQGRLRCRRGSRVGKRGHRVSGLPDHAGRGVQDQGGRAADRLHVPSQEPGVGTHSARPQDQHLRDGARTAHQPCPVDGRAQLAGFDRGLPGRADGRDLPRQVLPPADDGSRHDSARQDRHHGRGRRRASGDRDRAPSRRGGRGLGHSARRQRTGRIARRTLHRLPDGRKWRRRRRLRARADSRAAQGAAGDRPSESRGRRRRHHHGSRPWTPGARS